MLITLSEVRDKVDVWGSADLTAALTVPLVLVINNDALGETVDIRSEGADGVPTGSGTIRPGECWPGIHRTSSTFEYDWRTRND